MRLIDADAVVARWQGYIDDHEKNGDPSDEAGYLSAEICKEYIKEINGFPTAIDDRYRWHDLRKNPEDLPEYNDVFTVLVAIEDRYSKKFTYDTFTVGFMRSMAGINGSSIMIAWRYIEPFEEDEK